MFLQTNPNEFYMCTERGTNRAWVLLCLFQLFLPFSFYMQQRERERELQMHDSSYNFSLALICLLCFLFSCKGILFLLMIIVQILLAENSGMRPPTLNIFPSQPMHVEPLSTNNNHKVLSLLLITIPLLT